MNYISSQKKYMEKLLQRFLNYAETWSESCGSAADAGTIPSTPQQWDMAHLLEKELSELGLVDIQTTEHCYVYGRLPATDSSKDSILLLAHMDTVDEVSGKDVKPQVFENYDGRKIQLNCGVVHDPENDGLLALAAQNHETIITTDGNTLLGGDDKAGISAIMEALEYLTEQEKAGQALAHGDIEVIFSPDEETGHGMDYVPVNLIKSKYAYTVDGGYIGELESECFNAWAARLTFTGKACHTGTAKAGRMINACSMAASFISKLPKDMTPETTENYEPFIAVMEVAGSIESASLQLLLRAFTIEEIEKEKQIISEAAEKTESETGGKISIQFKQQYLNMKQKLDENPKVVEKLTKAFLSAGVQPVNSPIRGGTDGSRLTEMGIPTPNIFTGSHNFHSRYEWVSLNQMAKAADILLNLLTE